MDLVSSYGLSQILLFTLNTNSTWILPPLGASDELAIISYGVHGRTVAGAHVLFKPLSYQLFLATVLFLVYTLAVIVYIELRVANSTYEGETNYVDKEIESSGRRKKLLLLAIFGVSSVIYLAGMNPPGGSLAGTESKHIRRLVAPIIGIHLVALFPAACILYFLRQRDRNHVLNSVDLFILKERKKGPLTEARALKNQGRLHQMEKFRGFLHAGTPVSGRRTLKNLFKAIAVPPNAQAAGASIESESTSMGSYRENEQKNTSCSDSMVSINSVDKIQATWLVGSASTHHATGNRALLSDFKTVCDLNIQTGDGRRMPVSGHGSVITDTVVLPDVLFVPELNKNIVSVSQLAEMDCSIVFNRDTCYIRGATDDIIIGKAVVGENGIFKLEFLKVPLIN